jgi:hypothetical protein
MEPNRKEVTQSEKISFPIESGLTSSPSESNKSSKSPKKNRRRVDLRVTLHGHKFRLQAYEDTPDGQLLLWLKSLPLRERSEKIMEALRVCYYPYALAQAQEQGEDIADEEIQRAARTSAAQLLEQMVFIQFLVLHEHHSRDPQQEIKDWETARALVKARLGEHRYNYLSLL